MSCNKAQTISPSLLPSTMWDGDQCISICFPVPVASAVSGVCMCVKLFDICTLYLYVCNISVLNMLFARAPVFGLCSFVSVNTMQSINARKRPAAAQASG